MKKTKIEDLEKRIKCVESGHHWEITGLREQRPSHWVGRSFAMVVKCKTCGLIIDKRLCKNEHELAATILIDCLSEIGRA